MSGMPASLGRLSGWRAGLIWAVVAVEVAYVGLSIALMPDSAQMPTFARAIFALEVGSLGIVGALIVTRQPRNVIGWILWFAALAIAWSIAGQDYVTTSLANPAPWPGTTGVAWLTGMAFLPTLIVIIVFVTLLFPDGHLLSRRWRWVAALGVVAVIVAILPIAFLPGPLGADPRITNPFGIEAMASLDVALRAANFLGTAIVLPLAIASLVLRYRRGDPVVREQLKWLLAAIGLTGVCVALAFVPIPPIGDVGWFLTIVSISFIPIAIGIAILRYRLYEIDRIVSRTLGYGVVSIVLALTFIGVVLGLTAVLEPVTRESTIAVAASTLIVAALFQPLRRRVQAIVDRRFNRARYDAQRLVEAFSDRLRDEVDIMTVIDDLDGTIRSALKPTTLGLWLRGTGE